MEIREQKAIAFDLMDGKPTIKIFDEYSNLSVFEIRQTQLITLLHDLSKIIWNNYDLVDRR